MSQILTKHNEQHYWHYDSDCFTEISAELFEASYWQAKNAVIGQESGRGTTWFLQHNDHQLVLRHYLRGGMMRHISHDRYVFGSIQKTRSMAEFTILNALLKKGLPVPKPAAAQVIKHGLLYEADLLTHKVPNAQDLIHVLAQKQPAEFYEQLGALIAHFHQQGVFHADLNIQNILQDINNKLWLIDFDRAQILKPERKWQEATLQRLKRSFEKERGRFDICWAEADWASLMKGYQA